MTESAAYRIREMAFDDISPITEMEKENFSLPEVWSGTDFLTHLLREDALYLVAVPAGEEERNPETREGLADEDCLVAAPAGEEPRNAESPEDLTDEEWEDPEILGYAGILMVPDEADITKISVRKDMRRQGIGAALLEELKARAPGHGLRKIFLEVRKSNEAAIRLYKKCGFIQVGERKRYYNDPVEDALVMVVELEGELSL